MTNRNLAICFTGGKDSVNTVIKMANEYEKVHLLTFKQSLSCRLCNVYINIEKLKKVFGLDKFVHTIIDIDDTMQTLYEYDIKSLSKKLGWWVYNQMCGSCRLAMFVAAIEYCHKNDIGTLRDGANKTGFDISQQPWAFEYLQQLCADYGIDYQWCIYDNSNLDIDMFRYGINAKDPFILYRSQPFCRGGGYLHNVFLRLFFLPIYGVKKHEEYGRLWLEDRIRLCNKLLNARGIKVLNE